MDEPALCSAVCKLSARIHNNPAMSALGYPNDTGDQMRVTVLGTGTPYPEPQRFGPAILVEAASQKMLFDCGRGAMIRLSENGVPVEAVRDVYLTHLHSDHVTGLPDLWLTGWFLGRKEPLRVWGPTGTLPMTRHLTEAFAFDLQIRQKTESLPPEGAEFDAHEIPKETVYDDGPVRVTAFPVDHGPVKPAFGYRIDSAGHSVAKCPPLCMFVQC
jgi:ribonuclease Z